MGRKTKLEKSKPKKSSYGELVVVASRLPKAEASVRRKDIFSKSLMNYNAIREHVDHGMRMRVQPQEAKRQKFSVA